MKLIKIKEISAEEIFRLFKHLEKFSKETDDKKQFVLSHYKNFFPNLTFEQDVLMSNIIDSDDLESMKKFIISYPDVDVNLDGDSIINPVSNDGIKAKEKALIMLYQYLKKSDKKLKSHDKQIIKAFELSCLKNISIRDNEYSILKLQIMKKTNFADLCNIKNYEDIKDFDSKKFLSKVFKYTLQNNSETFLKYVMYYLDVVRLNKDSELRNLYLENIKNIL